MNVALPCVVVAYQYRLDRYHKIFFNYIMNTIIRIYAVLLKIDCSKVFEVLYTDFLFFVDDFFLY